ncbi:MAG TPA: lysophospholipid acyltransferase family protein [Acidimicrobiales bacterium]|nr:lysophospholipid acyltransferase family protein [Acidimicrobiales bacterium]
MEAIGAQFATQQDSLLLFFDLDGSGIDHVVMDVGSGAYGTSTIIKAAHTGTVVEFDPVWYAGLGGCGPPPTGPAPCAAAPVLAPGPRGGRDNGGYHDAVTTPKETVERQRAALVPLARAEEAPHRGNRLSDVDEWGRSEHTRAIARKVFAPIYDNWFRVEWEGLEKIPAQGGALLVANHAGAIPSDAPVIMHGIEVELNRPVYGMADFFFRSVPWFGTVWARVGGLPAHPDNALRLLRDQGQLALVFPEGTKGPSKTYADRYRLRRFGRGGFVEIAMRAGVPVIPIAVVGAEESMPTLFRLPSLARLLGVPYVPVTANMLAFGPLGLAMYFPSKFKLRVLDPVSFDVPAGQERYSKSRVMEEAEKIRINLQETIYEMLRERRSIWFG